MRVCKSTLTKTHSQAFFPRPLKYACPIRRRRLTAVVAPVESAWEGV